MSNLLYMDESNGNGVYASKSNNSASTTTAENTSNTNSNTAAAAAATAAATLHNSASNEDLSQSLSEYTDADESISAPTEVLAEFLSAVMLKDYKKALKYCKLILQYEPNNSTAREFYPLILDKLRGAASSDSDENYNKSSSPDLVLELQSSDPSAGESDVGAYDEQPPGAEEYGVDEDDMADEQSLGEPHSHNSNGCSRSNSNSSLCDSAAESLSESVDDVEDDDDDDDVDEDDVDEEEVDINSSSGDDLPIDEHHLAVDVSDIDIIGVVGLAGNSSQSSRNSSSGGGGRSRSDNTTHSYSSLLLEEEDDIVAVNFEYTKKQTAAELDASNGNNIPSTSCSDSESPTEPLTQRLAAILLSKCGVSSNAEN